MDGIVNHIFIIGYPCSGKTKLARVLSRQFNLRFIDSDDIIEKETNQSIEEIFETKGETFFRDIEKKVLNDYCVSSERFIMATGGGMPCFYNNIEVMKQSGICIYIQLSPEVLAGRIIYSKKKRPRFRQLENDDIIVKVREDLKLRSVYYSQAQYTVDGLDDCRKRIAEIINSFLTQG